MRLTTRRLASTNTILRFKLVDPVHLPNRQDTRVVVKVARVVEGLFEDWNVNRREGEEDAVRENNGAGQ